MVKIIGVDAKSILDSRKEKTILVLIKTNAGDFSASAPTGKSTGKHEVKPYKKNLEKDIETLKKFNDYFSDESIEKFDDLKRIEDILEGHIGANTLFAFESAVLKAIARQNKTEVWELINPNAKKIPRLVGNCVSGGKHSSSEKKPDFQEFLLIPNLKSAKENFEKNKKAKKEVGEILKNTENQRFSVPQTSKKKQEVRGEENAWVTSLNEKEVLELLKKMELPLGIDVAASSFYKRKKYNYENPMLKRDTDEQFGYLSNLIENFYLFYIEDPFHEEDFENFAKLLKKFPDRLIVGDDLIVTNYKRLEKAIEKKSVNGIIVKPNQCGSLVEVKKVCELAKKNNIKIIFSHRSGETNETILADLAFGFQADFFKCGIDGEERISKINRLIEIEKNL